MKNLIIRSVVWGLLCMLIAPKALTAQTDCNGFLGANIIEGGDFGNGPDLFVDNNPFLSPDLSFMNTLPVAESSYALASFVDNSGNNCWLNSTDNGLEPNGFMILINSDANSAIVYAKTLEICDGIDYHFSVDLLNLVDANCSLESLPIIEVLVNGQILGSIEGLVQDGNWHNLSGNFQTPIGDDILTLSIRSVGVANSSNDFAIDNIRLQHCGPEITLPLNSVFCPNNGALLSPDLTNVNYSSPHYQWQRSFDGGASWVDIANEDNPTLNVNNPINGLHYRLQVANGPVNFLNETCRAISSSTILMETAPAEVFLTPTICDGESLQIGDQIINEAGTYTTIIGGDSGCDSLIHSQVFVFPSYNHLYSVSLCSGDFYEGIAYTEDVILQEILSSQNGCDSIIVTEIDVSENANLTMTGNTVLCIGESTELSVSSGYVAYQWSTGEMENSIAITNAGNYAVTATNSQGCEISTTATVAISSPFLNIEAQNTSCPDTADGIIEVLAQGGGVEPYLYSLDGENWSFDPIFNGLESGEYTIAIQDAAGCEQNEQLEIAAGEDDFQATITGLPDTSIDIGDTLLLAVSSPNAGYTYSWTGQGFFECKTCSTTQWMPLQNGELSLTIINPAGCSRQIDTLVDVRDLYRVYFPTAFSPNGDGMNDHFEPGIGSNASHVETLEIYDRWGGQVFSNTGILPNEALPAWDGSWRGEVLGEGFYLYRAEVIFKNGRRKNFAGELMLLK